MMHWAKLPILSLLTLGLAVAAQASVFRVTGEAWNGWLPVDGLNWEKAYEAEMLVDGQRQMLYLYSTRYTAPVLAQLQNRLNSLGATLKFSDTEDGFAGVARKGEFEVRILVTSPKGEPRHLIFLTYPDPGPKKTVKFPVEPYPNGKILSTVDNRRTGTSYFSMTTVDIPVAVYQFYDQLFVSNGWKRMLPDTALQERGGAMKVYQRKNKVCYIQVRQGAGLSSTITLLVKKGTM